VTEKETVFANIDARRQIVTAFQSATMREKAAEIVQCKNDFRYFCDRWLWLSDPKNVDRGLPYAVPFVLYQFQVDLIRDILLPRGLHLEKSREMGATWFMLAFAFWRCAFHDGTQIKVFSRKEDVVDNGQVDSLFGKLRSFCDMLPEWLTGKTDTNYMRLRFAARKESFIVGESANAGIGRSGRYWAVLGDEYAFVPRSSEVESAVSFTTERFWRVSSVNGYHNAFGQLKKKMDVSQRISFASWHWSKHPFKDDDWFESQKLLTPDPVVIARELGMDYEAAVSGRIYDMFDRSRHVKTWATDDENMVRVCADYGKVVDPTVFIWYEVFRVDDVKCLYFFACEHDMSQKQSVSWWARKLLELSPIGCIDGPGDPAGHQRERDMRSYCDDLYQRQLDLIRSGEFSGRKPVRMFPARVAKRAARAGRDPIAHRVSMVRDALLCDRIFFNESLQFAVDAMLAYRCATPSETANIQQREGALDIWRPLHDWSSHFCDAIGYAVVSEFAGEDVQIAAAAADDDDDMLYQPHERIIDAMDTQDSLL